VTRANALWSIGAISFVAIVLIARMVLNESVLSSATNSVSGSATSVMLCEFTSNRMPTRCTGLADKQKESAIKAIRSAHEAQPPGHGIRKTEYVLKIGNSDNGEVATKCFVIVEYAGFERDLYLLPIKTGKNCSGETFDYAAGSIRVENFLHPPNQ
jgi:hypothetical protein